MPAERFFIKQARRFSAGLSVLYKNQCILRADDSVGPKNVTNSPRIPAKTVHPKRLFSPQ